MPAFNDVILHTTRLLLRPLREADAPSLLGIFSDAMFMRYGTTPPWKAMASDERIRLGIERVEDKALIGICTLFDLDQSCRSAQIGYGLGSKLWGNGYMNEALVALLEYGFSELSLNRIEADIDPENVHSAKSLARIGFKKEGHLRESCMVNGALKDSARYGLLRNEWNTRGDNPVPGENHSSHGR